MGLFSEMQFWPRAISFPGNMEHSQTISLPQCEGFIKSDKKGVTLILSKRKTCTNNLFPISSGTYSSKVNRDFIMIWCTHPGLVVYVVLVAVRIAAGEGYYGNLVNRFCHCKCFCHHLWTKVRHGVPEAKEWTFLMEEATGLIIFSSSHWMVYLCIHTNYPTYHSY